ncbi:MAG TPA: glycosyltransferase [Rubrobacteraceae bacterium]|nr:glycosyltransferase [Rubrobacteraceae bacterium]
MARVSAGRPGILFATVAVGGGHVATARAISEAIEYHYPDQFSPRVSDYMEDLGVLNADRRHKAFWRLALRYPFIARAGQRLIDSFPRLTVAGQRRLVGEFARTAAAELEKERPLLVVSNHGLLTTGLALARDRYGLQVPVLTYATEPYNISAYWADPRAEHVVVPAAEVRRDLIHMGVPPDKISVVSYPVRQPFLNAPSKAEARARLGLEGRFTCLVTLGGEGVGGHPHHIVPALLHSEAAPQVVVVTGRNKKLRHALEELRAPGLRVEGFVEEMALHVAASDVVIGKAGPASVYEALAVGRPVLVTGYAGLNELGVAKFVEREGFGHYVRTSEALSKAVARYAASPALLEEVALRSRDLDLAGDTERLARYVVRYALNNASDGAAG